MSSPDPTRDRELVARARALEVLRARRRRVLRELRELDAEIRTHRKLLDSMMQPDLPSTVQRAAELGRLGAFGDLSGPDEP